ncbi:MAG: LPS export ABC transporter periplasmic protein LptC [Gammaproteobacteria bacterium]|nr:LPS export ABC transporter periplasmic protein LptC [Gammaproteobacteria bacterium]
MKVSAILLVLAGTSAWLLHLISSGSPESAGIISYEPDFYIKRFTTTEMNTDGSLKNRLHADYMAHYPDNDTSELVNPRLEVFQQDRNPLNIVADKGWVTSGNEVILLTGKVNMWQDDQSGNRKMEINTTDVRILPEQEYAETDNEATFINSDTVTTATGVRAYFKEERIVLLDNVHTRILRNEKY